MGFFVWLRVLCRRSALAFEYLTVQLVWFIELLVVSPYDPVEFNREFDGWNGSMVAEVCQELPILDESIFEPEGGGVLHDGHGDFRCLTHDV